MKHSKYLKVVHTINFKYWCRKLAADSFCSHVLLAVAADTCCSEFSRNYVLILDTYCQPGFWNTVLSRAFDILFWHLMLTLVFHRSAYSALLYQIALSCADLLCAVLCYIVLYCTSLFCAVTCSSVLWCSILNFSVHK